MKKIITIILATILLFSCTACSKCGDEKKLETPSENTSAVESGNYGGDDIDVNYTYPNGIHSFKVKTASNDVIKNGETSYVVVISETADKFDKTAMAEFCTFFTEATGIILDVKKDSEVTYDENSKYFCIGKVGFLSNAGITITDDLGLSGYIVKTHGNSVFMTGKIDGTLYAVYEYLKWAFGYEFFMKDCYTLNTGVKNLKFIDFDVKEVPDIQSRSKGYGSIESTETAMRMGYSYSDAMALVNGRQHHTTFAFIDPAIYGESHPEYFSADKTQLSYTAHGNAEAVKEMQDIVFNKLVEIASTYEDVPAVQFTQQDINTWCADDIAAYSEKYGSAAAAASQIIFINPVAKRLQEWMDVNYPGREFTIMIFAYMKTVNAPTKLVNGEYVPIDDDVVLEPNVGIYYAPIEMDFTHAPSASVNSSVYTNFKKWHAICKGLYLWSYSVYFGNYFMPYDTFDSVQELYQVAVENGACYIFDEGSYGDGPTSAWNTMKGYIHVRLMWNCHYDMSTLIDKFIKNYYGDAAEKMSEAFDELRLWCRTAKNMDPPMGGGSSCLSSSNLVERYWPQTVLEKWLSIYDDALATIEQYKDTDVKTYNKYYNRIRLESASPRYLLTYFYGSSLAYSRRVELVNGLCSDINKLQLVQMGEGSDTSTLKESLLK